LTGSSARRRGFTLIEVLAVLFLTALVVGVALDFYVDLSNQSAHATEITRDIRRATSLLDRVARDLERSMMVRKPAETDPLAHPWIFVAESRHTEDGSDRIKFVSRQPVRRTGVPSSELSVVAFTLRESEDGDGFDLFRWSSPGLPDSVDRDFPLDGDPASLAIASDVHHFALRFLDEAGEWVTEWDSFQFLDSSSLPIAVEIEVAMAPLDDLFPEETEGLVFSRRVFLPVRPLDMETLLNPTGALAGDGDEGDDEDCEGLLVRDCVDLDVVSEMGLEEQAAAGGIDFETIMDSSWCSIRDLYGDHPAVKASCP
jgi:prepilin-type N-terminal cleavage/methylation domain-containing protein